MYQPMLTTIDNPYNPYTQFQEWFMFDVVKGYNSCAYLDRIAKVSDAMSEEEKATEIERAIDEIIKNDFLNIYVKLKSPNETIKVQDPVEVFV